MVPSTIRSIEFSENSIMEIKNDINEQDIQNNKKNKINKKINKLIKKIPIIPKKININNNNNNNKKCSILTLEANNMIKRYLSKNNNNIKSFLKLPIKNACHNDFLPSIRIINGNNKSFNKEKRDKGLSTEFN